ncbi:hypothetical protein Cgig2_015580 [Carnegiea gigantea]|uniref:Mei2-like C-terminal RNA recognition motif domain-containing protein n=1 Tax=Carnegiea gigantea TaxID=171969 RepID=A0A9Q1GQE5_9CARY|nr:hypothetical protein Cgig2_015580 [Carnegiea gigantea]
MESITVQRAEEVPKTQKANAATKKWNLNPKAKEFLPLLPPPPPPPAAHVVWHGGWFLSPPFPPALKPNFKYYLCTTPTPTTAAAFSYSSFTPPVLKLPRTVLPNKPTADKTPSKPRFVKNTRRIGRAMVGHRRPRIVGRRGYYLPKATADCAWVEKDKKGDDEVVVKNERNSALLPPPPPPPPPLPAASVDYYHPFGGSTTCLMIRNIPVRLSRGKLMELLDEHCREQNQKLKVEEEEPPSEFDFLYLPIDFMRKGNKGYAFVNFTSWKGAARLLNCWDGTNWVGCGYTTHKICRFSRARFQKSVFRCESEEYLPVEISPPRNGSNANVTTLVSIGTRLSLD